MLFYLIILLYGSNSLHVENISQVLGVDNVILSATNHLRRNADCPWLEGTTGENYLMECMDGTECKGGISQGRDWACCSNHGGRAKCPVNRPFMCASRDCVEGTDVCCTEHEKSCDFHGGLRGC